MAMGAMAWTGLAPAQSGWAWWQDVGEGARERHDVYLKLGYTRIDPDTDSGELMFDDPTKVGPITVVPEGVFPGSEVDVRKTDLASLTLGYMITRNLGIETILGLPALQIDFDSRGSLQERSIDPLGLVGPLEGKIGESKAVPLVATLVFYPWPDTRIRPYVGAGYSYTYTYDETITNRELWLDPRDPDTAPDFEVSDEWAWVAQLGAEVDITDKWFASVDVKYLDLEIEADISNVRTAVPILGSLGASDSTIDVGINPWVYTLAVGRTF